MPIYSIKAPDGNIYDIRGPENATEEQLFGFVRSQMGQQFKPSTPNFSQMTTAELEAMPSAPSSLSDIAKSMGIGVVGAGKALTDVFGAGSDLSQYLGETAESLQKGLSPARQAEIAKRQEMVKRAEASGNVFKEIGTQLGGVFEAPLQSASQAVGSSVPSIAAAVATIPLGAPAALATGVGVISRAALGAAQGVGEYKGSVFDAVKQAYKDKGYNDKQAEELAIRAQEYSQNKALELGGSALLGALDSLTGMESGVKKALKKAGKDKITKEAMDEAIGALPEKAIAKPGLLKSAAISAAGEAPVEGAQGGFGQYAENLALIREGLMDPEQAMKGVYGAAARDAAVGALAGTAFTPFTQSARRSDYLLDQAVRQEKTRREEEQFQKEISLNEQELPLGYQMQREELGLATVPSGYNIMAAGQNTPLATYATEDEAQSKIELMQQMRGEESASLLAEIEKNGADLKKDQDRLIYLEATGQGKSPEAQTLRENIPVKQSQVDDLSGGIYQRISDLQAPISVVPGAPTEVMQEQFHITAPDATRFGTFKTVQEARSALQQQIGEEPFKQMQSRKVADAFIKTKLLPQLQKFGLGNVGLQIEQDMEAGGSYSSSLIKLAMDHDNPLSYMPTMRHEAMHALMNLGFFSPQQRKALQQRAEKEWVDTYLKGQNATHEGQTMSRYDAYVQIFTKEAQEKGLSGKDLDNYVKENLLEEAIGDAFGAYDKGATPPPGMIAALYKKIKNFFANFKQAMQGAGFESADDIFQSIERGKLKPEQPIKPAKQAAPEAAEEKLSIAPAGIPQNIWNLHEKVQLADQEASGETGLPDKGKAPGALKRNQTMAFRRLKQAITDYVGDDEQAQLDLMVKMNEESSRRAGESTKGEEKYNLRVANKVAKQLKTDNDFLKSTSIGLQTGKAGTEQFAKNPIGGLPDVVQFLEDRRLASGLDVLDINNEEDRNTIAKLLAAEAMTSINAGKGNLQWYDSVIDSMMGMASLKYPELATSEDNKAAFRMAIAISSQGLNVEDNLRFAITQYNHFRQTGKFKELGSGADGAAMKSNFIIANQMIEKYGLPQLRKFLQTEFAVEELRSAGFEIGGELGDEKVTGSAIFGPKIGFGFYSNLSGNFEPVTMDMWFMRTIGRLTGKLKGFDEKKFADQLTRFRAALRESGEDGVYADEFKDSEIQKAFDSVRDAVELARVVNSVFNSDFKNNRELYNEGARKKSELVYAAQNIIKSYDAPKDAPQNGTERRLLRDVVAKTVKEVEQAYGKRIPPASLQALIWYPEQELYKALGVRLRVTSQDYAGAIRKILLKEGYDGDAITRAAESGSRGVQPVAVKSVKTAVEPVRAKSETAFEQDEREEFLEERRSEQVIKQEREKPRRKKIVFEVAPDPNNVELANRWKNLSQQERLNISNDIAKTIIEKSKEVLGFDGRVFPQVGSYIEDTNPSFALFLDNGNAVEISKFLGYALSQDSMMVISPKPAPGLQKVGAVSIDVGTQSASEIDAIYQQLRNIRVNGEQIVGGQSTMNNTMVILNYAGISNEDFASLIEKELKGQYDVGHTDVYSAFPEKESYNYANPQNDPRGKEKVIRERSRSLRNEATVLLEERLEGQPRKLSLRSDELRQRPSPRGGVVLGEKQQGAVSYTAAHYGNARVDELDASKYGTGLRGAERRRLADSVDPRIRKRAYFYIQKEDGTTPTPEAGVGQYVYTQQFDNILPPGPEMSQLFKDAQGDSNQFESNVIDAGYDGYASPSMGMLVILNHNVPVNYVGPRAEVGVQKLSLKAPTTPEFKRWFGDSKVVEPFDPALKREGMEYEGRLFGGGYSGDRLKTAAKDAPIRKMIAQARIRYNNIREELGLPEVTDWTTKPDYLVQRFNGKPMVMYHGTFQGTDEGGMTIPKTRGNRNAFFVSPDADFASKYALNDLDWYPEKGFGKVPEGAHVYPVYISAKNPFDYENDSHTLKIIPQFRKILREEERHNKNQIEKLIDDFRSGDWSAIEWANNYDLFEKNGFDAFYTKEQGRKNLGVFRPQQIKSATGNLGTYNKESPDIRYSLKNVGFPSVKAAKEAVAKTSVPETSAFKRFIGASQWVDKDGKAKVFYHATAGEFFEFTPAGSSQAIFLAETPEEAETFGSVAEDRVRRQIYKALNKDEKQDLFMRVLAGAVEKGTVSDKQAEEFIRSFKRKTPEYGDFGDIEQETYDALLDLSPSKMTIMPLYARAETPFDFENQDHVRDVINWVANNGDIDKANPEKWLANLTGRIKQGSWQAIENKDVQRGIRAMGHDGFTIRENKASPKNYAVYQPNQLKSVTGNDGQFSLETGDIRYSLKPLPALSKAETQRLNEVATKRLDEGWVKRLTTSLGPKPFSYIRQKLINRYQRLADLDKDYREWLRQNGGAEMLADQSAENAALMSDLSSGVMAAAMGAGNRKGGIPVYKNGITTIDTSVKGLVQALMPLAEKGNPEIYQRYQFWAGWKRARRMLKEGREKLYEPQDAALAQKFEQMHPEFKQVYDDLNKFNDGLVKYAVQTGVLSKERGDLYMKYGDYIPFYRQLDLDQTIGPNVFHGLAGVKGPTELKGGESGLADFLETMVRNTQSMINAGMKNAAAQVATRNAMQIKMVQRLAGPPLGSYKDDIYSQLENGQQVFYRSHDKLYIDAVKSLNIPEIPFLGFLSGPANLLRNLVTKEPGFMMANLLRDSLSAYVTSGANMTPVIGSAVNFAKGLTTGSPGMEALFNSGLLGGYEFSHNIERSGKHLSNELARKSKTDAAALRPFKSLWEGLERGTTASDAATRVAIYERVLAETGNEAEALSRAMEVMNFNRKGNSALIRILTAAVPFFNARLQGLDVFYRASTGQMNTKDAKEIQRRFWIRGATMAALSVMYYMAASDDDEYKKQEAETKDNNWIVSSLGIKVPIPFEVGTLFKTIPERIYAVTLGDDTAKDFTDSMKRALLSTLGFNPTPQTFKPILEAATNFNFFTWRPIVGKGMEGVAPEYQIGPGTSKGAEYLGQLLGMSPLVIDHIWKGYTGTLGQYITEVSDYMLSQNNDSPKASKRFEQMPIIKRFALDPAARGSVTEYYQLKDAVDTTVRTMNLLEKTARPEDFAKYVQKNAGYLVAKDYVRDLDKTMKELREMRGMIQTANMTADEKRDALLAINQAESNLTSNIHTVKVMISQLK